MKKMRNLAKYGFGAILLLGSQALLAQQRYSVRIVSRDILISVGGMPVTIAANSFVAHGLNDNGLIAGAEETRTYNSIAGLVYSTPSYVTTELMSSGTSEPSRAYAINNTNVAVGYVGSLAAGSATAAVYYPSSGVVRSALRILPQGTLMYDGVVSSSVAKDINDIGWVVGQFSIAPGSSYPFAWVPNSENRTQGTVHTLPCSGAPKGVVNIGLAGTITDGSANVVGGSCNRRPYVWIYGVDVDLTAWLPTSIQVPVTGSVPPMTVSRDNFLSRYGYACSVAKITNNWRLIVSCNGGAAGPVSFITQGEEGLQQPLVQFSLGPKTRYDRPPARAYNSLVLTDINEAGCVVGYDGGDVVFSYCNGGFSHLDLPPGFSHGSYSNGVEHTRINDNGQVLVNSRTTAAAALGRPVLFTPVP